MSATILLVDYDPKSIARIRGILTLLGAEVVVAKDGAAGAEEFERAKPDLALIQDLIPKKHGFDLCKDLKATEFGARVPIVLMTHPRAGRRGAIRTTRCDDILEKPFDNRALVQKVLRFVPAELLRESAKRREPVSVAPLAVEEATTEQLVAAALETDGLDDALEIELNFDAADHSTPSARRERGLRDAL